MNAKINWPKWPWKFGGCKERLEEWCRGNFCRAFRINRRHKEHPGVRYAVFRTHVSRSGPSFNLSLVWKLDRLSRSLKDLINTLDELGSLGIDFVSYDNNLDTSTPTGKLVFQIVGAVAEFEKDIIKERVIAGLANARRKGKRLGRPPIAEEIYKKAQALRRQGLSFRKIGRELGIDEGTIRKKMKHSA